MADFSDASGRAIEAECGRARLHSVRRGGDDGNLIRSIREDEVMPERAIRVERDGFAADGDLGLRVRAAVENDFGVDVHEELALGKAERADVFRAAPTAGLCVTPTRKSGLRPTGGSCTGERGGGGLEPAGEHLRRP